MKLDYTYWQEKDGWYLGYLNDYPDHWTQGKSIPELEDMLKDLYELEQEG
jgi:predicted RNase H-like HicB family nuclease